MSNESCVMFFLPPRAFWGVILRDYSATGGREREERTRLASRSLLVHFKPELTPNYWKSHLSDDGYRSLSCCSISSPNLNFIPPTVSEKIHAEFVHTAFSIWSVLDSATREIPITPAVSNSPISGELPRDAKRWLVNLKRPAWSEFLWSLSRAPIILRKPYARIQHGFSRKLLEGWSSNLAKR